MYEMECFLQETEDINWTVVRPPGLKNLPASGERHAVVVVVNSPDLSFPHEIKSLTSLQLFCCLFVVSMTNTMCCHVCFLCSSGVSDPRGILCSRPQRPASTQLGGTRRRGSLHAVFAQQQRLAQTGRRHHHEVRGKPPSRLTRRTKYLSWRRSDAYCF